MLRKYGYLYSEYHIMVVVRILFFSLSEMSSCSSYSIVVKRSVVVVDISSMLLREWSGGRVVILIWLSMLEPFSWLYWWSWFIRFGDMGWDCVLSWYSEGFSVSMSSCWQLCIMVLWASWRSAVFEGCLCNETHHPSEVIWQIGILVVCWCVGLVLSIAVLLSSWQSMEQMEVSNIPRFSTGHT